MSPGTAAVFHGAWYTPDVDDKTSSMPWGVDHRGTPNFLIGDEHWPHVVGALLIGGLVEVEKMGE